VFQGWVSKLFKTGFLYLTALIIRYLKYRDVGSPIIVMFMWAFVIA